MDNRIVLLKEAIEFVTKHSWIFDFSNVRIFADNVISEAWPPEWTRYLRNQDLLAIKAQLQDSSQDSPFFSDFVLTRNRLAAAIGNQIEIVPVSCSNENHKLKKGLSPKKQHEVDQLVRVVDFSNCDFVVDVGSGAGHLERVLLEKHPDLTAICVESQKSQTASAEKWSGKSKNPNVKTVVATLDESEESQREIESHLPKSSVDNGCLVSLHACGDLTNAILNWFVLSKKRKSFKNMSVVSCCYHKMKRFPVSKTLCDLLDSDSPIRRHFALRLACQERFGKWLSQNREEHEEHSQQFGRRAILELVIKDLGIEAVKQKRHSVTKSEQKSGLDDFITNALERYDFGEVDTNLLRDKLKKTYETCQTDFHLLEVATGLQLFLQVLLEYIVTMDRILFLHEYGIQSKIVQAFNELLSPRCWLIQA